MNPSVPAQNPFREGLRQSGLAAPCTIVLFGATGDLTQRKLIPALYNQLREGNLPANFAIVGFARRDKSDEEFRNDLLAGVRESSPEFSDGDEVWKAFAESIFYHRSSFDEADGYASLGRRLSEIDASRGTAGNRLFYLATAPEFFAPIVEKLGEAGLAQPPREHPESWVRVVVEKPFGEDLDSAVELNRRLLAVLHESQIYRIDHYLGKETVQNILAFRFSNGIFEPIWNNKYVDHVQITVAESLGVGGRGPYYDAAGALRDMVQNHMLQLLSLVAMEPPVSLRADAVRDEKVKVLQAIRPFESDEVSRWTVRGQYTEGSILGEPVRGYREEERVPADSKTGTYAALRLAIDSWRWAGVPFLLRHGKRLPRRATEIAIQFRKPPMPLFSAGTVHSVAPNALILNIQPDEGISLCFGSKVPGPDIRVQQVKMDFRYGHSFGVASPDAYERLLVDAMAGDSTLFTRRDEVESSWRLMAPILEAWESSQAPEPEFYSAGSWGPEAAERLLEGTEGSWRRL